MNREDVVRSVPVSVQETIFVMTMTMDEDMKDDNGTPFLVLHVYERRYGSARLYCKRAVER